MTLHRHLCALTLIAASWGLVVSATVTAAPIDPMTDLTPTALAMGAPTSDSSALVPRYDSGQTTHYSVADAQGNVVSTTYTLNQHFGTGTVAEGTGGLLNDEMDDFSSKPGVANAFGLVGGEANAIAPSKRPPSLMTPAIAFRAGKPWLVTGLPDGSRIITTVLQTIVNAIDFGVNPAESTAAPRFHHQGQPDELRLERGFSPDTTGWLRAMGHHLAVKPVIGYTQTIERRDRQLYGASDPRNPDGLTAGF